MVKFSRASQLPSEKRSELRTLIFESVRHADYERAMRTAEEAWKTSPGDFAVCCDYASLLGDYAEFCAPAMAKKLRMKSIRMMRSLLRRTHVEYDRQVVAYLRNEYYWQTKKRRAQYDLGTQLVKEGYHKGYYSQGVGAAWSAFDHARRGQIKRASHWARLAIKAWQAYEAMFPNYYNQYVHLALAEGVLGQDVEMETSLRQAAKLAAKNDHFSEFQEIRTLIAQLPKF